MAAMDPSSHSSGIARSSPCSTMTMDNKLLERSASTSSLSSSSSSATPILLPFPRSSSSDSLSIPPPLSSRRKSARPSRTARVSFAESAVVYSVCIPDHEDENELDLPSFQHEAPLSEPREPRGRSRERSNSLLSINHAHQRHTRLHPINSSHPATKHSMATVALPPPRDIAHDHTVQYSSPYPSPLSSAESTPPASPRMPSSSDYFAMMMSPSPSSHAISPASSAGSINSASILNSIFVTASIAAATNGGASKGDASQQAQSVAGEALLRIKQSFAQIITNAAATGGIAINDSHQIEGLSASASSSTSSLSSLVDNSASSTPATPLRVPRHHLPEAAAPLVASTRPRKVAALSPTHQAVHVSLYLLLSLLAGACLACIVVASYGLTLADDVRLRVGSAAHQAEDATRRIVKEVKEQAEYVREEYWEKELKRRLYEEVERRRNESHEVLDSSDEGLGQKSQRRRSSPSHDSARQQSIWRYLLPSTALRIYVSSL